jgi:hypothetical protein
MKMIRLPIVARMVVIPQWETDGFVYECIEEEDRCQQGSGGGFRNTLEINPDAPPEAVATGPLSLGQRREAQAVLLRQGRRGRPGPGPPLYACGRLPFTSGRPARKIASAW